MLTLLLAITVCLFSVSKFTKKSNNFKWYSWWRCCWNWTFIFRV